jgi:hypothetical protein
MILKCFAVVRAIAERAHLVGYAAHGLSAKHVVHAYRAFVHGPVHAHAILLMKMVCVTTGIAAVGVGGLAILGIAFGSAAPGESGVMPGVATPLGPLNPPASFGQDTALPLVFETGWSLDEAALPLGEGVDSVFVAPIPTDLFNNDSLPDTPNPPAPVPEPASIWIFGAYLLGFLTPWQCILNFLTDNAQGRGGDQPEYTFIIPVSDRKWNVVPAKELVKNSLPMTT